jgi:hypothetical protein
MTRDVAVTKVRARRVIQRFRTIRQAEQLIAKLERRNPEAVHRGDYGIDASERADAQYQRLRRPA